MIRGVLTTWASEDDRIVAAIQNAKEQLYVATAQLQYLDTLGSNVGVFRPTAFNLSDSLFRQLIPALSFAPKQVLPTIHKVLAVFFGASNPRVLIHEIRPGQIEIQIPSTVPALRRSLRGSLHFHNYSGSITSVDNLLKDMVVALDGSTKLLVTDELKGATFGQGVRSLVVLSNTSGATPTLQFSAGSDLSVYPVASRFNMALPKYPGSFVPNPTQAFTVKSQRGVLGQTITAGQIVPTITMTDASGIPNAPGLLVFGYGTTSQESLVKYFGRPNNTTLFIDPVYTFTKSHTSGETINVIVSPYQKPRTNGADYSAYVVGVSAARILAQQIVASITAAGVVINWTIVGPVIDC